MDCSRSKINTYQIHRMFMGNSIGNVEEKLLMLMESQAIFIEGFQRVVNEIVVVL
jgi:hypothetical protein